MDKTDTNKTYLFTMSVEFQTLVTKSITYDGRVLGELVGFVNK